MDLHVASAYWALDKLPGEELPGIAVTALQAGFESESLVILAGERPGPRRDLADLFTKALAENNVVIPDRSEAVLLVARYYAQQIVDSSIKPYSGLEGIVSDACYLLDQTPDDLLVFIGLKSEYDDFSDSQHVSYYGQKYCDEIHRDIDSQTRDAARKLLEDAT